MGKTHEALDVMRQIRSKLDEARALSRGLGTPEEPHDLAASLDTIIMGLDAHIGALESAGDSPGAQ